MPERSIPQDAALKPSVIFEQLSHGKTVRVLGYAFIPESGSSRLRSE